MASNTQLDSTRTALDLMLAESHKALEALADLDKLRDLLLYEWRALYTALITGNRRLWEAAQWEIFQRKMKTPFAPTPRFVVPTTPKIATTLRAQLVASTAAGSYFGRLTPV